MRTDLATAPNPFVPGSVRIELPAHLRRLAGSGQEVIVAVSGPVTQRSVLDALERDFPALIGTVRDQTTHLRRPFIRFFTCEQDLSLLNPDHPLPPPVAQGAEPFLIIGAIAGG